MKFTEAKDYEVVVVDAAYNEAKLSFAKDVTAPKFNVNDGYKTKDNIDVVVTETHLDRVEVTNETTGEKVTYTTNEFTLTNEGVYTLVAFDKANLTKKIKVEIDKTAPNGYDVGILNVTHYREENPYLGYAKVDDEIRVIVHFKEQLATLPTLSINGVSLENEFFYAEKSSNATNNDYVYMADVKLDAEFIQKVSLVDGDIKFTISGYADAVGNDDEELTNDDILEDAKYNNVEFDTIAATMDYSTLYFEETGKVAYDVNGYKTYYMKNGDSVVFRIAFHEELNDVPTVTIGGQNVEMTSKGLFQNNDGEDIYVYEGTFKIAKDEATMTEGMLEIKLSNVADLAGNVATDEAVLNQTPTSNKRVVIYDRTFVKKVHLYALNLDKENHKLIRDNENLYLELVFDEEIVTNPIVKVGDGSEVSMACSWRDESQGWPARLYKCDATITIDGKSMNLTTNQNIPITIKNIKDAAGNETVLTEANLTNNDIKGYGQVVYDMTPPVHATLGITGYENENYDTHYITYGKGFRVALYFNEELSEVPKVKFDNFDKEYTAVVGEDTDASKNIYSYIIDIPAGDVNAKNFSEGEIKFQVYGYKDLAGNEGEVLDNKDIKHPTQTKVVIDKTASADRWVYILNWNDSSYRTSISDGETLLVEATFNEPLQTMPTLEIGNSKFVFTDEEKLGVEDHYAYRVKVNINSSLGLEEGKEIPFKITNIVDLAGNKAESLYNNDVVYHQDKGYGQVVYENPIVSLTFHNATHYKEKEDLGSNVSVTEESYGDTLRVFVRTSQDFALAYKPIININGFTKELNLSNMYNDGTKDYGADIKITDEMNLTLGEEIPFTIENIVLENGNALPNLTNEDITSNTLSGVVLVEE